MAETYKLTIRNIAQWTDYKFSYYGTNISLYNMVDEDGKVYVWKTSSALVKVVPDETPRHNDAYYVADKGDVVEIRASVKGESEYKGEKQTELTRCKLINILKKAPTKEQLDEAKAKEQLASLKGEDFIWEMPYKQYKEHYADCETLAGSFCRHEYEVSTIKVIIREGRLKASGVRGQHFHSYEMTNELGQRTAYVAVCEDNAIRRAEKDYPEHEWVCTKIFW